MRTVKILETFDGFPRDKRVTYTAGEEVDVPNAFADMIIEKGHAKEVKASSKDEDEETAADPEAA